MPLSDPVSRQLRHQRVIRATAYERNDGLWDIDACVTDHKPRDVPLGGGVRPNGLPIHELWLRITIDCQLNIVNAESASDWAPYGRECQAANPAYRALIGLNLLRQFRREVKARLSGTMGCTHLTELCNILPTVAIQALAGDAWNTGNGGKPGSGEALQRPPGNSDSGNGHGDVASADAPPFQLGRCHALRFDGNAVKQLYPRWYGRSPYPFGRE